eukprot:CAMPEP_0197928742 /NCGR_PEP_ID=MMETSP1439-20131203/102845_1 /TAXON_ID=66791 /ORGANISM="Gonyaulax spinifera, Strain CCMP409" /LENGTH=199 /DNA_ID=CAMNT_0043551361 /DNA_START=10 /DNA_END=605 /DNA_ORIENTATION=+
MTMGCLASQSSASRSLLSSSCPGNTGGVTKGGVGKRFTVLGGWGFWTASLRCLLAFTGFAGLTACTGDLGGLPWDLGELPSVLDRACSSDSMMKLAPLRQQLKQLRHVAPARVPQYQKFGFVQDTRFVLPFSAASMAMMPQRRRAGTRAHWSSAVNAMPQSGPPPGQEESVPHATFESRFVGLASTRGDFRPMLSTLST